MMQKGVTGKILTTIISLVLGIMALALLWFFLSKSTIIINAAVQKIITGIKCKMFCHKFLTFNIGFCSGC